MEGRQRERLLFGAMVAVLAIVAGALFFAYRGLSDEQRQLTEANRTLGAERDALKKHLQVQGERVRALETDLQSLRETNAALRSENDQRNATATEAEKALTTAQGELTGLRRTYEDAQRQIQSLAAEKEALTKKLAEAQGQATSSAAARADLSRELRATAQTLDDAKARAARLNKAYEGLLKEKSQLAAADAARQAELEKTKRAFEEAQSEVARLTGARGIYTVQNADSLSTIAAFFYRNGNRWPDIFRANAFLIDHPDLIYPGQVLIVPQ